MGSVVTIRDTRFVVRCDGFVPTFNASLRWMGGPALVGRVVGILREAGGVSARFELDHAGALGRVIRSLLADSAVHFEVVEHLPTVATHRNADALLRLAAEFGSDARATLGADLFTKLEATRRARLAAME